jgi:DNA-binding XRE family transcriptional regulator
MVQSAESQAVAMIAPRYGVSSSYMARICTLMNTAILAQCSGRGIIGENIKRVRNKLGLTQDDLVWNSGVKHTTLTKIESNVVVKPSAQTDAKFAKALGVPME